MRIVVLAGHGMLGHKVFQVLGQAFPDTWCTLRGRITDLPYRGIDLYRPGNVLEDVDAMDLAGLEARLAEVRPDYVVNCVGVIKQRPGAVDPVPCITLNSLLPHRVATAAAAWGGRLVHFSTDCVFDGKKGQYTEEDPSTATDLYGRTKFLGEVHAPNALTIRTSFIGRELSAYGGLLEWFRSQDGKSVGGYVRAMYSGVTTNHIAAVLVRILLERPELTGLYQVAGDTIAKHDLLVKLRDAYGLNITINAADADAADRTIVGAKFVAETGITTPGWDQLIAELVADPTPYEEWIRRQAQG